MEANGINTNFHLETRASTELTTPAGTFCFARGTGLLTTRHPRGSAPGTASPLGVSPTTPHPQPEGPPPESLGSAASSPVSPRTLRPNPALASLLRSPHPLLPVSFCSGGFSSACASPAGTSCHPALGRVPEQETLPCESPPWKRLLGDCLEEEGDHVSGKWSPSDGPRLSLWALKQGSCDSVSPLALGLLGGVLGGVLVGRRALQPPLRSARGAGGLAAHHGRPLFLDRVTPVALWPLGNLARPEAGEARKPGPCHSPAGCVTLSPVCPSGPPGR